VTIIRFTARHIVKHWLDNGVNLPDTERILGLDQGSLKELVTVEGPAEPSMETLLNILNTYPELLDIAAKGFKMDEKQMNIKKLKDVQPGEVIAIPRDDSNDILLILAIEYPSSFAEGLVAYTHWSQEHADMGRVIGTGRPNQRVHVIEGNERTMILKDIREKVLDQYFKAKEEVDLIELVVALSRDET